VTGRRFVVACEQPMSEPIAVGPVYTDESAKKLTAALTEAGWRVVGPVRQLSAGEFYQRQKEKKAAGQ
jgi:hypothetical protein